MDSNQILTITVFVIVITIVGTIALAVVGYVAFRLRERKHPSRSGVEQSMTKPYFFERIRIPEAERDEDQQPAITGPPEQGTADAGPDREPVPGGGAA